jgi:uncharacterized membrane protein
MNLFLQVPGSDIILNGPAGLEKNFPKDQVTIGYFITKSLPLFLYIMSFVMAFWVFWGVFQYIFAGGDKNALAAARKRIQWALVGFLLIVVMILVAQYAGQIFPQLLPNGVTNISTPTP